MQEQTTKLEKQQQELKQRENNLGNREFDFLEKTGELARLHNTKQRTDYFDLIMTIVNSYFEKEKSLTKQIEEFKCDDNKNEDFVINTIANAVLNCECDGLKYYNLLQKLSDLAELNLKFNEDLGWSFNNAREGVKNKKYIYNSSKVAFLKHIFTDMRNNQYEQDTISNYKKYNILKED